MEKSGTRYPVLKAPIVARSDARQSPSQRIAYGAVTVAFWAFWIYLWLPVLALLAWSLGVQQAYKYMVVLEGYREVLRLLCVYLMIVVSLGGALILWAGYNIARFSGVERRSARPPITPAEIARDYGMDPADIARWQVARSILVTHDPTGRIAGVSINTVGAPAVP